MNLQITIPYQKCPFKCPMCIATDRPTYENVYKNDISQYEKGFIEALREIHPVQDIVLTGNTDPTLDRKWLKDIRNIIRGHNRHVPIELQTKNYNLKGYDLTDIDVLSYSITSVKDYLKAWKFRKIKETNRLVILLTKEFDWLTAENFQTFDFEQITFKVLQHGASEEINEWVDKNKMQDLTNIYKIIDRFNGTNTSVRIDTNCQNSVDRYRIFREDGKLYKEW